MKATEKNSQNFKKLLRFCVVLRTRYNNATQKRKKSKHHSVRACHAKNEFQAERERGKLMKHILQQKMQGMRTRK